MFLWYSTLGKVPNCAVRDLCRVPKKNTPGYVTNTDATLLAQVPVQIFVGLVPRALLWPGSIVCVRRAGERGARLRRDSVKRGRDSQIEPLRAFIGWNWGKAGEVSSKMGRGTAHTKVHAEVP